MASIIMIDAELMFRDINQFEWRGNGEVWIAFFKMLSAVHATSPGAFKVGLYVPMHPGINKDVFTERLAGLGDGSLIPFDKDCFLWSDPEKDVVDVADRLAIVKTVSHFFACSKMSLPFDQMYFIPKSNTDTTLLSVRGTHCLQPAEITETNLWSYLNDALEMVKRGLEVSDVLDTIEWNKQKTLLYSADSSVFSTPRSLSSGDASPTVTARTAIASGPGNR